MRGILSSASLACREVFCVDVRTVERQVFVEAPLNDSSCCVRLGTRNRRIASRLSWHGQGKQITEVSERQSKAAGVENVREVHVIEPKCFSEIDVSERITQVDRDEKASVVDASNWNFDGWILRGNADGVEGLSVLCIWSEEEDAVFRNRFEVVAVKFVVSLELHGLSAAGEGLHPEGIELAEKHCVAEGGKFERRSGVARRGRMCRVHLHVWEPFLLVSDGNRFVMDALDDWACKCLGCRCVGGW